MEKELCCVLLSFSFAESFFVKINLFKKKWLVNCFQNLDNSGIAKDLKLVSRSLDPFFSKYGKCHTSRRF